MSEPFPPLEATAIGVLNSLDFMRGGQHGRMESCADLRASRVR